MRWSFRKRVRLDTSQGINTGPGTKPCKSKAKSDDWQGITWFMILAYGAIECLAFLIIAVAFAWMIINLANE